MDKELNDKIKNLCWLLISSGVELSRDVIGAERGYFKYSCKFCNAEVYNDAPNRIHHKDNCLFPIAIELLKEIYSEDENNEGI